MAALTVLRDRFGAGEGCGGSAGCSSLAALVFPGGLPHRAAEERERSRAAFLWLSLYSYMLMSRLFGFSFPKAELFKIQHNVEQTTKPEEQCLVALLQTVN